MKLLDEDKLFEKIRTSELDQKTKAKVGSMVATCFKSLPEKSGYNWAAVLLTDENKKKTDDWHRGYNECLYDCEHIFEKDQP